jgi:hypothetical protein
VAPGPTEDARPSPALGSVAASAGDLLTMMCPRPWRLTNPEDARLRAPGEAKEAEKSHPSDSVVASAGDLLTMMCPRPWRLANPEDARLRALGEAKEAEENRPSDSVAASASAGDLLTTMCRGSPPASQALTVLGEASPCATLLVILGSVVHSSAGSNLLTRLTRGFPVVGCARQRPVPLAPPILGPKKSLTKSGSGVWAGGPLHS